MGASIEQEGEGTYAISTAAVAVPKIPHDLGRKLRASLVFVGPLLARFGWVEFPHPGGCVIGKRSIDPHLAAFRNLGAQIELHDETYTLRAPELVGTSTYLKERSVTGTENIMMAATRAKGRTIIYNAAEEQHIVNLAALLREMGYNVSGAGTSTITIEGSDVLSSREAAIEIIPDEIEIGTFAVAAAVTGGDVTLEGVGDHDGLLPILSKLEDFGVAYSYDGESQSLSVRGNDAYTASSFKTGPWPGFPTDLQAPFTVLATQAEGTSLVHDWMFEGRLYFVELLQKMGANIVICDPHRALVSGPTPLYRSTIITPDIRAGAAMVLAALAAEGTSTIEHIELIERGYAQFDERLRSLGADITRE
jgi:UDP-N-acetylglucosamine 1-carboxyvinyltransferase